jgi:hypothetical protein
MCISAKKQMHSLTNGKSGVLEEFIHAESREEAEMIFYAWADIEAVMKQSQKTSVSFQEGLAAIKYCISTGCGVLLN